MTVHVPGTAPVIPGYGVSTADDGWVAERLEPLSDYQMTAGCLERVVADDARELELLCVAETAKAVLVAEAERLRALARVKM